MRKKILITGAYGFIGTHITAQLYAEGYEVICAGRNTSQAKRQFPYLQVMPCDFSQDVTTEVWLPRLKDIHIVINCVGVLQTANLKTIEAIHYEAPRALYLACEKLKIEKVIHISALGADEGVPTPYAQTKQAIEQFLMKTNLNWIILRPSLVYSTGSFGGTSLFRALAAIPFIIPLVGKGDQNFQPVYIKDLTTIVSIITKDSNVKKLKLDVVGPEILSLKEILLKFRTWLGFPSGYCLNSPLYIIKLVAKFGDYIPAIPINTTSFKMLMLSNTSNAEPMLTHLNFIPQKFDSVLNSIPSSLQDRWHARLYFLKPILQLSLGLLWLYSGLMPLLSLSSPTISSLYGSHSSFLNMQNMFYFCSAIDIILGLVTFSGWRLKECCFLQFLVTLIYTFGSTIIWPSLWLNPFGPIVKNIPLLFTMLILGAMAEKR